MSLKSRIALSRSRRNPKVRADDPEPSLDELLDDPVLQLLMARDGVARADLLEVIDDARSRLGIAAPTPALLFERTLFAECRA
jgi:hypothetical protein